MPINRFIEPIRTFYEVIQDGIIITDLNGRIHYSNHSAEKMLSHNREQLINKEVATCFNSQTYLKEIILILASKQTYVTNRYCKINGDKEKKFTLCFSLINPSATDPIGIQIIFKNPNTPSDEQTYFEKHSSMLHTLNYQLKEAIIISDIRKRRNLFCSQAIETITGWKQRDFNEGGWAFAISLTHPEDSLKIVETFSRDIKLRQGPDFDYDHVPIIYEYRKRHKNGNWIWIHAESLVLERDEDNEIKYMITFLKDKTEEKSSLKSENSVDVKINDELEFLITPSEKTYNQQSIHISKREKEILELVKKGFSTKEIADILQLKITSINTYRKSLMQKLNAKNTAELVERSNQINIS